MMIEDVLGSCNELDARDRSVGFVVIIIIIIGEHFYCYDYRYNLQFLLWSLLSLLPNIVLYLIMVEDT